MSDSIIIKIKKMSMFKKIKQVKIELSLDKSYVPNKLNRQETVDVILNPLTTN